jgi:hypothetical protein
MTFSLTTVAAPKPGEIHTPFWPGWWRPEVDSQWLAVRLGLAPDAVHLMGSILWMLALAGFTLGGLGILGVPLLNSLWISVSVIAAAASLILLLFFWHPWLVMGVLINMGVLLAVWQSWPAALFAAR